MSLTLGVFTAGEIPAPLVYGFEDADGTAIDLTGFDAKFAFRRRGTAATIADAVVTNGPGGQVTYQWQTADMTPDAMFVGEFVVENGANRYTSEPIRWRVRAAVGAVTFP